mgnify:CR=1 FL=1
MAELVEFDVMKNKRFVVGDEIKLISQIEECDKPEFIELDEAAVLGMFKDLIKIDDKGDIAEESPSSGMPRSFQALRLRSIGICRRLLKKKTRFLILLRTLKKL